MIYDYVSVLELFNKPKQKKKIKIVFRLMNLSHEFQILHKKCIDVQIGLFYEKFQIFNFYFRFFLSDFNRF